MGDSGAFMLSCTPRPAAPSHHIPLRDSEGRRALAMDAMAALEDLFAGQDQEGNSIDVQRIGALLTCVFDACRDAMDPDEDDDDDSDE